MINYKLAKKLKEAGFPQEGDHWYWKDDFNEWIEMLNPELPDDPNGATEPERFVLSPTLSELIEACGYEGDVPIFKFLSYHSVRKNDLISTPEGVVNIKEGGRWNARARTGKKLERTNKWIKVNAWGKTSEEAVAKLWLKLNAKPKEERQ